MHFDVIYNLILDYFPTAEMGEDSDGQLIIYTGLKSDGKDHWWPVDMEEEDENDFHK